MTQAIKSLWDDDDAARFVGDLGQRVYSSRLLGREKSLVLHGGGNTSVKVLERNLFGKEEEILYVKGSGWDLESIEPAGFSPVRMGHLLALARLERLSDPQMVNEMMTHMTRFGAPAPSVETILHACLPYKFVDHTHADAVIALTNTPDGERRVGELYGSEIVLIPYVMPGFDLARLCARRFPAQASAHTIGMVLMNHGIFSFGASARESYERMIHLVNRAEEYLAGQKAWSLPPPAAAPPHVRRELATLRREVSEAAGFPAVLTAHQEPTFLAFCNRDDLAEISQQGPATPDHVIRTKRLPMLGRDLEGYVQAYREYFERHARTTGNGDRKAMLDPAPRVILDGQLGLVTVGRTAKDALIVFEIYAHTIEVILRATALGGFRALSSSDLFDVEYWDLEQTKLKGSGQALPLAGEIAMVTGAASGIGKACVDSLLGRGAAVVGLDVNPAVTTLHARADFLGLPCDLTDEAAVADALETATRSFGGLDMLVLNAGIFPASRSLDALPTAEWRRVMSLNLDANLVLLRECHPLLALAPRKGRVIIIGSKNVAAPGPGVGAYSTAKAALVQLGRIAALEWGRDGIRVNIIHPDGVFDTAIWTDEVLASRAARYGLTVDEYKRKNVLGIEVRSRDVAELAAEMCGPLFAKITGGQVPLDGGNERVI